MAVFQTWTDTSCDVIADRAQFALRAVSLAHAGLPRFSRLRSSAMQRAKTDVVAIKATVEMHVRERGVGGAARGGQ